MVQTYEQFHHSIAEQLALTGMPVSERAIIVTRIMDVLAQRIFVDLLPSTIRERSLCFNRYVIRW